MGAQVITRDFKEVQIKDFSQDQIRAFHLGLTKDINQALALDLRVVLARIKCGCIFTILFRVKLPFSSN